MKLFRRSKSGPAIRGHIDRIDDDAILGWVFNETQPAAGLVVQLLKGTQVVGIATADEYRKDLKDAGIGDGSHAFTLRIPDVLRDGNTHELRVVTQQPPDRQVGAVLAYKTSYSGARSVLKRDPVHGGAMKDPDVRGFLNRDPMHKGAICGWALDKRNPSKKLVVQVLEDSGVIASAVANKYRKDLEEAGIGDGSHGFAVPVPSTLRDGRVHQLRVVLRDKPEFILGELSFNGPVIRGKLNRIEDEQILGWARDDANPENKIVVQLTDGSSVLARAVANEDREDVRNAGEACGFSLPIPATLRDGKVHELRVLTEGPSQISIGDAISFHAGKPPTTLDSLVYSVTDACVRGWAFDPEDPTRKVSVAISIDGKPVATVVANELCSELTNRASDSRRGFELVIPRHFLDGSLHVVTVTTADSARTELHGSPRYFSRTLLRILGRLDSVAGGVVTGWAFNPAKPTDRVQLTVRLGETSLITFLADSFREDLLAAGIGDGYHGFGVRLPADALAPGQEVTVTVLWSETDQPLKQGTKRLLVSKPQLEQLRASQGAQVGSQFKATAQHRMRAEYPHELLSEFIAGLIEKGVTGQQLHNMPEPLVSIVMPTFNRAKQLAAAIQSVQRQGYRNWALHIVDDGSDDGTADAVRPFLVDSRITFERIEHKGVSAARNASLARAQGEFVAYLDSDNTWNPHFLSVMIQIIRGKTLDAAYSAIRAWDDDNSQRYRSTEFDFEALKVANYIDLNAFVHRRDLFDKRGGFDESLKRMVDWDFILKAVKGSKVELVPFIGVEYNDSKTHDRITTREPQFYEFAVINKHALDWERAMTRPRVTGMLSIIVVNLDQLLLTQNCVLSILQNTHDVPYEIVLVDNGSRPHVKTALQESCAKYPQVRFLSNAKNMNFALGYNIGAVNTSGEFLIALNNDTTVTPGWAKPLVDRLSNDTSVGVVQPKLLYPDGTIQCAGAAFSRFSPIPYHIYQGLQWNDPAANRPRPLNAVTGAAFAVRAQDFFKLRGFNPIYVNGCEDTDYCLRMKEQLGLTCFYEPKSSVYHAEGKTAGRGSNIQYNRRLLGQRWEQTRPHDDTTTLAEDGFVATNYREDVAPKGDEIPVLIPTIINTTYLNEPGRRVLLVKPSGLGNMVMSTPALQALRELLPQAHITMLCFWAEAPIAEPFVDEVLTVAKDAETGAVDKNEVERLIAARHFDIALYLPFTNLGLPTELMKQHIAHHVWHPKLDYANRHEAEHSLDLVRMLGWQGVAPQAMVRATQPAVSSVPANCQYVGLHIGASASAHMQRKRWPLESWRDVVREIAREWHVVFFGGLEERPDIELLISMLPDEAKARCLIYEGSAISEVAYTIGKAIAFLSNDSGLMHLAAAVRSPVVAVFGPTSPSKNAPLSSGGPVEIVRAGVSCSPCYMSHPAALMACQDQICLSEVSPEMVLSALRRALGRGKADARPIKPQRLRRARLPS